MRALLLVFLLAVSIFSCVASAENKPEKGAEAKGPAEANRQINSPSPLLVKVVPAEKTQPEADQEQREKDEKASNERKLVWSTVALAIVTALLAIFTGGLWLSTYRLSKDAKETSTTQATLMRESIGETTKSVTALQGVASGTRSSADAARLSAETLEAIHLPYLVPELREGAAPNIPSMNANEPFTNRPRVEYCFVNYGPSPAFIRNVFQQVIFCEDVPVETGKPIQRVEVVRSRNIRANGTGDHIVSKLDRPLTTEELRNYRAEGAEGKPWRFYLLIQIEYFDVFGKVITERFCMKVMPGRTHLEQRGGRAHNWRLRKEVELHEATSEYCN